MRWWKILCVALLLFTFIGGFMVTVPDIGNLQHTIRNAFFHIPMWITQFILVTISLVYSIKYLRNPKIEYDIYASEFAATGIVFGILGLATGMIWANYTWGAAWSNDPKQLGVAIALLIYLAYFVLRNSMPDLDKRARISSVYNIFAYFIYIPMIMVLPRLVESLHPGGKGVEGNPGLNGNDMNTAMKWISRPAYIGWALLGLWITTLRLRLRILAEKKLNSSFVS
ncbi:MAG: cytochrome c biogenesis protein CcsA [Chitinophagaceae bacterium]|nr:cytochrome c biogenesis protein CcsA [Chitinophagaceae bacterium]